MHGTAVTNLAAVSTSTSAVVTAFRPQPNNTAFTLALHGSQLIVGGSFTSIGGGARAALASVSATTGALTSFTNLGISGVITSDSGLTRVYKLRASPNGARLLALGNFSKVAGAAREQAFIVDLGATSSTLDAWYSPLLSQACAAKEPYYVRAGTWSPDGSRVYFATTGDFGVVPALRHRLGLLEFELEHVVTDLDEQDRLRLAVLRCGGHQCGVRRRSPALGQQREGLRQGRRRLGGAARYRRDVGELGPGAGVDPTRARGHGAHDQLRTSTGLWIGSDNYLNATQCGGVYHPGICFFPNG